MIVVAPAARPRSVLMSWLSRTSGAVVDHKRRVGGRGGRLFPSKFHAFQSDYSQDYPKSNARIAHHHARPARGQAAGQGRNARR